MSRVRCDSTSARLTLIGEDGLSVPLASLWIDDRAVVVFLRHFGCRFCKSMLSGIAGIYDALQAADVRLICVGIGTLEEAAAAKALARFRGSVFVDPDPESPLSYLFFQLKGGIATLKASAWLTCVLPACACAADMRPRVSRAHLCGWRFSADQGRRARPAGPAPRNVRGWASGPRGWVRGRHVRRPVVHQRDACPSAHK